MSTGTTSLAGHKARAWLWPALFSLVAFAANSVFCRLALKNGAIDPASFTVVRLASGAVFLLLLIRLRRPAQRMGGTWRAGLALCLYALPVFSGLPATERRGGRLAALRCRADHDVRLCLVQGRTHQRKGPAGYADRLRRLAGAVVARRFGAPFSSALLMVISGIAWGRTPCSAEVAQAAGRHAGNFARSPALAGGAGTAAVAGAGPHLSAGGLLFALGSGVLARSRLCRVVWRGAAGRAQQAATLQLSVPVLAGLGGVALIGEPLSLRLLLASVVVLGGIALALVPPPPAGKA